MKTLHISRNCSCSRPVRSGWTLSMKRSTSPRMLAFLLVLASLCGAQVMESTSTAARPLILSPADKDKVLYVTDFELDPDNFKQDKGGVTGKGSVLPPPPPDLPRLGRKQQDPATEAQKLVRLMSESLVSELTKAGLTARRLLPTDARPAQGLLLSGVFTEVDEGNQMRRALLGFGSGASKMELYVTVTDASRPELSLYGLSAEKSSGKKPGAVITLNPYVGAAKFVMTKNAPEKTVKKTASLIATDLTRQLNGTALAEKD
jgi:hypothetical protein